MWSQEQAQLLIDLYKTHPCLYAVKHKDHKNRHARNNALLTISKELAQVRPGTSPNEIKNKFNNIRTNFMAIYRKYCSSFRSGMGEAETYKPNIWYFDSMMFIVEHSTPREAVDDIPTISEVSQESQLETDLGVESQDNTNPEMFLEDNIGSEFSNEKNTPTPSTNIFSPGRLAKSKSKKRKLDDDNDVIEAATGSLRSIREALTDNFSSIKAKCTSTQTQSEIFGEFVAKQLSFIEQCDEEGFLDVQHEVTQLLYGARKRCLEKN